MSHAEHLSRDRQNSESLLLLTRVFDGDDGAVAELVDRALPVVQTRVARALLRNRALARGRDVRLEVEDLTQEVFAALFANGAKTLRAWDPARGLSLMNFVGLIAEHRVSSILHSDRRSPWTEEPTAQEDLELACGHEDSLSNRVASRQLLGAVFNAVTEELTPKGAVIFRLLYVEERSVGEVAQETGMSADALYAWRSRLSRFFKQLRRKW